MDQELAELIKDHHYKIADGFKRLGMLLQEHNKTVMGMLKELIEDEEVIKKHAEKIEAFEDRVTEFIEKTV